jgi:hypothetical protein
MALVTVSATVPQERVADLLRYAASLHETDTEPGDDGEAGNGRVRWGWGRQAVHEAYLGGTSDRWRPFLDYLANRPDQWVPWKELLEAIDFIPQQGAGMLGAAERRCHQRPPYEKRWNNQVREFRMPAQVADYVKEVAEE